MQEEIFGPVLPVIAYDSIDEALAFVKPRTSAGAVSVLRRIRRCKSACSPPCPGGGCINDTIVHLATSRMGFGGVGQRHGSYTAKEL